MSQVEAKKQQPKKLNLEYERTKDNEPVKGIFRFHEVPGGTMEFSFLKYKGDQVKNYKLVDGEIYTIPLMVAKHLNKGCWYPVHSFAQDEEGRSLQKIGQKVRRCSFQSLEFVDIDDLTPVGNSLITVENVAQF